MVFQKSKVEEKETLNEVGWYGKVKTYLTSIVNIG